MVSVSGVTTDQLSLLAGDTLSQHRFIVCSLLEDALRILRTAIVDGRPASRHDVDHALRLVQELADELRLLPGEEPAPF